MATKKPVSLRLRSRSQSPEKPRPKSLQKEDCDVVWNELDQLRKENKILKAEKFVLLCSLLVAALLRTCLLGQREIVRCSNGVTRQRSCMGLD